MVDPYLENLRSASDFTHNNWMNQQRREQTAREINTQRNRQNFIYQASAGLRPPEFTAANIPAPQPMPNPVAPPVDPASVQAAPVAAAPSAGLKTSRQNYTAQSLDLNPVISSGGRAVSYTDAQLQASPELRARLQQLESSGQISIRRGRSGEYIITRNVAEAPIAGVARNVVGAVQDTADVVSGVLNPGLAISGQQRIDMRRRARNNEGAYPDPIGDAVRSAFTRPETNTLGDGEDNAPLTESDLTELIGSFQLPTTSGASAPTNTAQPTSFTPTQAGTLDTRNPQDLARISQAIGLPHSSTHRTPERNAQVGGVPNSRHLFGNAIDFPIPEGWTIEQANQHVQQQWRQSGFPPAEFIASDHGTGPHVHVEWGGSQAPTGAPQTQFAGATPTAPRAQQIFHAVSRSPEGLPFTVRTAQNEYDNAAAVFQAAQANGMLEEAMAAATTMRQANVTAMTALGFQAALDIIQSGNPARFQQYYQAMTDNGSQITFQPFTDGTFSYSVDGVEQGRGTREEIASDIMSLVNTEYLQQQQEAANERNQAQFESSLRMREDAFSQQLEGQRDLTQAAFEAELERRNINPQSVRVVEIDAEGTRGVIYQTPEGRIVLRPIRQSEARGPSTGGRGETTIIHGVGPEIDVTDQLNG